MPIQNPNLEAGTRLVANYKKQAYVCMVVAEGEGLAFVLEDGRRFKSLSSAGSAVMDGKAVNGWRFWSVETAETTRPVPDTPPRTKANSAKSKAKPARKAR